MVPNLFLGHLQPFLVEPYFDQVQNKGSVLLAAGQFETRLQEFGLWTSLARWELTSQALYYNLPYLFTDVTTIICYSFLNQSFWNPELTVFQKTILNLKFKIPAHNSTMLKVGILNFKFRIVFWRLGGLKKGSHFLKKATFSWFLVKAKFKISCKVSEIF